MKDQIIKALYMERCKRKMNQGEVDKLAGLPTGVMHKVENGKVNNIAVFAKVADAFGGCIVFRPDSKLEEYYD